MIRQIIYGIIGLGYFLLGFFIIYYQFFIVHLKPFWANVLGILFIVYGAFRVYRGLKSIKNND